MSNHHRAIEIARDYSNKLPIFTIILPFSLQRRGPHEQDKNAISRLHFWLGCRLWLIWIIGLFRKPNIQISQPLPTPTSINIDRSSKLTSLTSANIGRSSLYPHHPIPPNNLHNSCGIININLYWFSVNWNFRPIE